MSLDKLRRQLFAEAHNPVESITEVLVKPKSVNQAMGELLADHLTYAKGNVSHVSLNMGISKATIYRLVESNGLRERLKILRGNKIKSGEQ